MKMILLLSGLSGGLVLCAFGQGTEFAAPSAPGVVHPRIISKTEAQYSEQAQAAGIQGRVVIQLDVGVDGFAHNLQVMRTLGSLDERAMEAVRSWRFQPGTKDGRPVETSATVEVDFRLSQFTEQETVVHRYARHQHEQAIEGINFKLELRRKDVAEINRLRDSGSMDERRNELAQEVERLSGAIKTATEQVPVLEYRMAHADDCARVYLATMGNSALTVTEGAVVEACQSAGLYPPHK
jgi:TonB family protein